MLLEDPVQRDLIIGVDAPPTLSIFAHIFRSFAFRHCAMQARASGRRFFVTAQGAKFFLSSAFFSKSSLTGVARPPVASLRPFRARVWRREEHPFLLLLIEFPNPHFPPIRSRANLRAHSLWSQSGAPPASGSSRVRVILPFPSHFRKPPVISLLRIVGFGQISAHSGHP